MLAQNTVLSAPEQAFSRRELLKASLSSFASLALFDFTGSSQGAEHDALIASFDRLAPKIAGWIEQLIKNAQDEAKVVGDFSFPRLRHYYSAAVLEKARVVIVDRIPQPPLSDFGIEAAERFLVKDAAAITYGPYYFVKRGQEDREALHFHELVHTVQYATLGIEGFVRAYGYFLITAGYEANPFEQMARELSVRFEEGSDIFNPAPLITERSEQIASVLKKQK